MRVSFLTLTICLIAITAYAKYSGGRGVPNDPYQIATAEDLMLLGETPEDYDKHFILTADIDLAGYVFDKAVIGSSSPGFTGVFDGNGHTISHLTITGGAYVGLFGRLAFDAEVKNLGVVDVNIADPANYAGGLVADNSGDISHCYSTGAVRGNSILGGLVGENAGAMTDCHSSVRVTSMSDGGFNTIWVGGLAGHNKGIVARCYSTGPVVNSGWYTGGLLGENLGGLVAQCYSTSTVSGGSWVGGLVGWNIGDSLIMNSYSTGTVSGIEDVGGLVGSNKSYAFGGGHVTCCYSIGPVVSNGWYTGGLIGENNGTVTKCFWDVETSGHWSSAGKTTAEMQNIQTYLSEGWDFVDEIENGTSEVWQMPQEGGYPVLSIFNGYIPHQLQGEGTSEDSYLISDVFDLGAMTYNSPDAHYRLTCSIDLSDMCWGVATVPWLAGVFDGDGLTLSHLTINGGSYLGLFGYVASGAEVKDLGILDVSITGSGDCVAGLVGQNSGAVNRCYSIGSVSVSGSWEGLGGLVGVNYRGSVLNSYSTCTVNGGSYVGGLVGYNFYGDVTRCYSAGSVRGSHYVGGLMGANHGAVTIACFWDTQTSGQIMSAGGTGKTAAEMQTANTFLEAGWDFVDETANGTEDIWWILEGKDYPRLWWEAHD